MFGWLRKLIGGVSTQPPPTQPERTKTLAQPATVYEVVDRFLTQNPAPTPYSVHALIAAGAADLAELQVCEKIQEHGYQYPLNPTLRSDLTESELLGFLVWQAGTGVDREEYRNENTIRDLIGKFREETGK